MKANTVCQQPLSFEIRSSTPSLQKKNISNLHHFVSYPSIPSKNSFISQHNGVIKFVLFCKSKKKGGRKHLFPLNDLPPICLEKRKRGSLTRREGLPAWNRTFNLINRLEGLEVSSPGQRATPAKNILLGVNRGCLIKLTLPSSS